jgi:adenine phosphoribosyltransferase
MPNAILVARRWFVSGRVQGVGFRWFVHKHASELGMRGWVRNEDDGRVQVYAMGTQRNQLNRLGGVAAPGAAAWSEVRGVEEHGSGRATIEFFSIPLRLGILNTLKQLIREIPDFPKPGILFYDITTLLKDKRRTEGHHRRFPRRSTKVRPWTWSIGIEARGFIFAPALAYALGAGFVPVRKPKKLPAVCESISYDLEYGSDTLEVHRDAIVPGSKVLIVDDLLATGGTAKAVTRLVEQLGGSVAGLGFVLELTFLSGP